MPIPLRKPSPPPDLAAEVATLGDADILRLRAIARLRAALRPRRHATPSPAAHDPDDRVWRDGGDWCLTME